MSLRAILSVLVCILIPAFSVAADQRLSDLLLQIQRLQQEVQRLHGRVDLQEHALSTLKRRQREQYLDLDARLRDRSAGTSPPPASGNTIGREALQAPQDLAAADAPSTHSPPVSGTPNEEQQAYHNAFDLLKQRRYGEAVRGFEDLLARYPNGEFADNARYWLGETNYVKRDYATALTQFQRVTTDYPLSPKVSASLLKIGYIHYEKGDWQRARRILQNMIERFPDTTEARLAASRLERMTREGH
ncbi:tol-pal system protein YbgF [Candidatus Thiosymbion oneisti]|uniref:tol-pal system protein YbgF n=1 Tax=Candidatus Thiosymbion oneisti TaxID=589554 RepID=UPI000B7D31A2|nr:tol-pal system protein YbgF [Candidatus Thiosymbion oneisti]